jgi:amidase
MVASRPAVFPPPPLRPYHCGVKIRGRYPVQLGAASRLVALIALGAGAGACMPKAELADSQIVELTAVELETRLAAGAVSAERVTRVFLERIAALDDAGPMLAAVIEVNPDAIRIARDLDQRRRSYGPIGPLHGIPVLLKASIDTADALATSAGSLALASHHAAADAPLVARLRAAGAVILGKTNLSEWANFRATRSTSGWSSLGGQTRNAYVLDRNPCGSSSGSAVAVAARLAPLSIGTETDGSIVCPAAANGVVGIKPTLGLVSGRGIVPIAKSQDTAGPIARTVRDAALLLSVIEERNTEHAGGAADAARAPAAVPYAFSRTTLTGVRVGVVRDYSGAGSDAATESAYADAIALLRGAGAEVVDPVEVKLESEVSMAELQVLLHEFRVQLDEYLDAVRGGPRSLEELIEYDTAHAAEVMPFFGQDLLIAAHETHGLDSPVYVEARATVERFRASLASLFADQRLDALVAPANSRAWIVDWVAGDDHTVGSSAIAAVSGYPSVTVPTSIANELPLGLALIGTPHGEAALLEVAAVFEAARGEWPPPRFLPMVAD